MSDRLIKTNLRSYDETYKAPGDREERRMETFTNDKLRLDVSLSRGSSTLAIYFIILFLSYVVLKFYI